MSQNTIELAISALEAEKVKIDAAIAELRGGTGGRPAARKVVPATARGEEDTVRVSLLKSVYVKGRVDGHQSLDGNDIG